MDTIDPYKATEEASQHMETRRNRAEQAFSWFENQDGLVYRQDAVQGISEHFDWTEEQANVAIGDLLSDTPDPVQQVTHPDGKYVGIIDYDTSPDSGCYGFVEYDDRGHKAKRVVCARCVEIEEGHENVITVSEDIDTDWEDMESRIVKHIVEAHDIAPEDVNPAASLASPTTIGGNEAFHKGNESQITAENIGTSATNTSVALKPDGNGGVTFGSVGGGGYAFTRELLQRRSIPFGVERTAPVYYDGTVYILGHREAQKDVLEYDVSTNKWSNPASLSSSNSGKFASGEIGGIIYAVRTGFATLFEYDPETQTVSSVSSPPWSAPGDHAGGVYNGKLYWVYGNSMSDPTQVNIYDPATDTLTTGSNAPVSISGGIGTFVGNKLYAGLGGTKQLTVYDADADSWSTLSSMPELHKFTNAFAATSDAVWVAGGEDGNGESRNTIKRYDVSTDTWDTWGVLPQRRKFQSAVSVGGDVHIIGGRDPVAQQDVPDHYAIAQTGSRTQL